MVWALRICGMELFKTFPFVNISLTYIWYIFNVYGNKGEKSFECVMPCGFVRVARMRLF